MFFAQKYPIFTSKLSQGACSQNVTWFTCVMSVDLTQIKTWRNARRRQWGKVVDTAWLECRIMRAVLIPFTHLAFQCTPFLRFIPSHTFPHRKFITTGVNEKSFLFLILDSCWEELCSSWLECFTLEQNCKRFLWEAWSCVYGWVAFVPPNWTKFIGICWQETTIAYLCW